MHGIILMARIDNRFVDRLCAGRFILVKRSGIHAAGGFKKGSHGRGWVSDEYTQHSALRFPVSRGYDTPELHREHRARTKQSGDDRDYQ